MRLGWRRWGVCWDHEVRYLACPLGMIEYVTLPKRRPEIRLYVLPYNPVSWIWKPNYVYQRTWVL